MTLFEQLLRGQMRDLYKKKGIVLPKGGSDEEMLLNIGKLAEETTFTDANGNPRKYLPLEVKQLAWKILYPNGLIEVKVKLTQILGDICCTATCYLYRTLEEKKEGMYCTVFEKDFMLSMMMREPNNYANERHAFESLKAYAQGIVSSRALAKYGIGLGLDYLEEEAVVGQKEKKGEAVPEYDPNSFNPVGETVNTEVTYGAVHEDFLETAFEAGSAENGTAQETEISTASATVENGVATETTAPETVTAEAPKATSTDATTGDVVTKPKRGRKPKAETVKPTAESTETLASPLLLSASNTEDSTMIPLKSFMPSMLSVSDTEEESFSHVFAVPTSMVLDEEAGVETAQGVEIISPTMITSPISPVYPAPNDDGVQVTMFDAEQVEQEEEVGDMTLEEALACEAVIGKNEGKTYEEILTIDANNFRFMVTKAKDRIREKSLKALKALEIIAENDSRAIEILSE